MEVSLKNEGIKAEAFCFDSTAPIAHSPVIHIPKDGLRFGLLTGAPPLWIRKIKLGNKID